MELSSEQADISMDTQRFGVLFDHVELQALMLGGF